MPVITGSSTAEVAAPIERCWALVEDVAIAPQWQGGLVKMDVLERDEHGRPLICDALSDAKLRKVHTRVQFTYDGPTRLAWTMLEGDLDSMDGSWQLEDLGGARTRATYALAVDPGSFAALARPDREGRTRDPRERAGAGARDARRGLADA